MITETLQTHTNTHETLFNERAAELIEMVRTRHPEARLLGGRGFHRSLRRSSTLGYDNMHFIV
jgi:hypothetical protein